jgi:GNAT superfamily N-acetyltransferase
MAVNPEPAYLISTDKSLLDIDVIHRFLFEESYWANRRTREQTVIAIGNSICFGAYDRSEQIGFLRVVTDKATFAYIGDVFVLPAFRGRGLSKMLMDAAISHPELQGLRRWLLATKDAHGLYEQFGFAPLVFPDRWMERSAADAYAKS